IRHKGQDFQGQHPAIVDLETWEAARKKLSDQAPHRPPKNLHRDANPLRGKLFDEEGQPLTPEHSTKAGKRYRYYVSRTTTQNPSRTESSASRRRWRLPAHAIEQLVTTQVKRALTDRGELTRLLTQTDVPERRIADLAHKIHDRKERHQDLVSRVDLSAEIITIQIDVSRIVDIPGTVLQ